MTCNKGQKPNELLKIKCGSIWINMNVIFLFVRSYTCHYWQYHNVLSAFCWKRSNHHLIFINLPHNFTEDYSNIRYIYYFNRSALNSIPIVQFIHNYQLCSSQFTFNFSTGLDWAVIYDSVQNWSLVYAIKNTAQRFVFLSLKKYSSSIHQSKALLTN